MSSSAPRPPANQGAARTYQSGRLVLTSSSLVVRAWLSSSKTAEARLVHRAVLWAANRAVVPNFNAPRLEPAARALSLRRAVRNHCAKASDARLSCRSRARRPKIPGDCQRYAGAECVSPARALHDEAHPTAGSAEQGLRRLLLADHSGKQ